MLCTTMFCTTFLPTVLHRVLADINIRSNLANRYTSQRRRQGDKKIPLSSSYFKFSSVSTVLLVVSRSRLRLLSSGPRRIVRKNPASCIFLSIFLSYNASLLSNRSDFEGTTDYFNMVRMYQHNAIYDHFRSPSSRTSRSIYRYFLLYISLIYLIVLLTLLYYYYYYYYKLASTQVRAPQVRQNLSHMQNLCSPRVIWIQRLQIFLCETPETHLTPQISTSISHFYRNKLYYKFINVMKSVIVRDSGMFSRRVSLSLSLSCVLSFQLNWSTQFLRSTDDFLLLSLNMRQCDSRILAVGKSAYNYR